MDHEYISQESENMKQEESRVLRQLGQRIRYFRRLKSLTQEELGEQANVSHKYIGEIERGKKKASIIVMYRLSCAMQVSMTDLISFSMIQCGSHQKCMQSIIRFLENKNTEELKRAFNLLKICLR